jgi:hypothetical protein
MIRCGRSVRQMLYESMSAALVRMGLVPLLLLLLSTLPAMPTAQAQGTGSCDWCAVGSGPIGSLAPPLANTPPVMASDPISNILWLAWLQASVNGYEVTMANYSPGTGAPSLVSTNGLPLASPAGLAMVVRDGQPVIAYVTATNTGAGDLQVWQRRSDGSWSQLGVSIESAGQNPSQPSLALSTSNHLGIAWQDGQYYTAVICYKQFDDGAHDWKPLGSANPCGRNGTDAAFNPVLAFDDDNPTIAFIDETLIGAAQSVQIADLGSDGTFHFTSIPIAGGSGQAITGLDLTSNGSTLYVAWSQSDVKTTLTSLDTALRSGGPSGSWSLMMGPDGVDPVIAKSKGDETTKPSIIVGSDGVPWLTWSENTGTNWQVYAAMWDTTKWEFKGDTLSPVGVLINSPSTIGLIGPTQGLTVTPYVALYEADGLHLVTWTGPTYSLLNFEVSGLPSGLTAQLTIETGSPTNLPLQTLLQDGQTVSVSVSPQVSTATGQVFSFQGWTTTCASCLSTTAATTTLSVTRAATLTAVYQMAGYLVTFTANLPSSAQPWSVLVNNNPCANPCSAVVQPGQVIFTYPSTVSDANSAERYVLVSTNPAGPFQVNTAAPNIVTATYKTQYRLTLQSNPPGLGNLQTGTGNNPDWFDAGTKAPISADPLATDVNGFVYAFNSWTSAPSGASIDAPSAASTAVTMNQPYTLTANYAPATVHVQFIAQGLPSSVEATMTLDANACKLPCNAPLVSGTTHQFSFPTVVTDPVSVGTRYVLTTVQNGSSPYTVKGDANIVAVYKTQYFVKLRANHVEVGAASLKGEGWADAGSTISLHAPLCVPACSNHTVSRRWYFSYWSGAAGISPTNEPTAHLVVTAPATVLANYVLQYRVIVTANQGRTKPAGTNYYTVDSKLKITFSAPRGTTHTAAVRYAFAGWRGQGKGSYTGSKRTATIVIKGPISEQAIWTLQYRVIIASDGLGSQRASFTVNTKPVMLSDRQPYQTWISRGTRLSVRASHYAYGARGTRYAFMQWLGVDVPTKYANSLALDLTITNPMTLTAKYQTQYYLWSFGRNGTVSPQGGWYPRGATVTLTTKPRYSGLRFVGWQGRGKGSYSGRSLRAVVRMFSPIVETAIWQRP